MSDRFKIFHLKAAGDSGLRLPEGYWHMATCLRSIVLTEEEGCPESLKNHDFMRGEVAYEFLLKVVCGLESPLLGETEILGQFKEFLRANQAQFSPSIRDITHRLNRDAKNIRTQFLQNLGCTSYGSLLRKELKDKNIQLTVLGAGSLAQDIFPWFAKQEQSVFGFTRKPGKYDELAQKQNNLQLFPYEKTASVQAQGVLVVAAPLSAGKINKLFDLGQFEKVYDLRGDSHEDTLGTKNVVTLQSLFANIEKNKQQAVFTKKRALSAIKKQANLLSHIEKPRPFGWEDLCAYS